MINANKIVDTFDRESEHLYASMEGDLFNEEIVTHIINKDFDTLKLKWEYFADSIGLPIRITENGVHVLTTPQLFTTRDFLSKEIGTLSNTIAGLTNPNNFGAKKKLMLDLRSMRVEQSTSWESFFIEFTKIFTVVGNNVTNNESIHDFGVDFGRYEV